MFGKFKGEKKPAAQPINPPQELDTNLQQEKVLHDIKIQREKIDESMSNIETKVIKLDQEIRSFMSQGKKQQAKGKIAEMKGYQKQSENYQLKYNVLTQMMIQLEMLQQDADSAKLFEEASKLVKEQEQTNDRIKDAMLDWRQNIHIRRDFQVSSQETQELFKQMATFGINNEEIDEEFAQYEMEVNQKQIQKASDDLNQVTIPQTQQIINQQPQQQQNIKQDQMEQLLT